MSQTYSTDSRCLADVAGFTDIHLIKIEFWEPCSEDFKHGRDRFAGEAPGCPKVDYSNFILVGLVIQSEACELTK